MENDLKQTVIDNGFCVGCGVCAVKCPMKISMELNASGMYSANVNEPLTAEENAELVEVCPFSGVSENENEIGRNLYSEINNIKHNSHIGYFLKNYAGHVKEKEYRSKGSSGGFGTWICDKLLETNKVDYIIHVGANTDNNGDVLFKYQISESMDEVRNKSKSKYYPIEMSEVITIIKNRPGRYAIVGVPCFIKGIRLIAKTDIVIRDSIKYTVGLVCGHLKSNFFAKSISWELGIHPNDMTNINFRNKINGNKSSDYGVVVSDESGEKATATKNLLVTNWGHGLFKYKACDYCDDALAELADVTIGDAWLEKYEKDSLGTNLVIIRNPEIEKLFEKFKNVLELEELTVEEVYQTQAGGFRHKREGLKYRVNLLKSNGDWVPLKREFNLGIETGKRVKVYNARIKLTKLSFILFKKALEENNYNSFSSEMSKELQSYDKMVKISIVKRAMNKFVKVVNKKIGK